MIKNATVCKPLNIFSGLHAWNCALHQLHTWFYALCNHCYNILLIVIHFKIHHISIGVIICFIPTLDMASPRHRPKRIIKEGINATTHQQAGSCDNVKRTIKASGADPTQLQRDVQPVKRDELSWSFWYAQQIMASLSVAVTMTVIFIMTNSWHFVN